MLYGITQLEKPKYTEKFHGRTFQSHMLENISYARGSQVTTFSRLLGCLLVTRFGVDLTFLDPGTSSQIEDRGRPGSSTQFQQVHVPIYHRSAHGQVLQRTRPGAADSYHIGAGGTEQRENGEERYNGCGCSMRLQRPVTQR